MDNKFDIQEGVLIRFEGGGSVRVPENVCEIGEYSFIGNNDIKEVVIGAGVTRIGQQAFRGCSMLESVTLPEGLKEIGRFAFCDCGSLERINMPESLDVIENSAFRGCDILKTLDLPESMTRIGESAFSDCRSIERIAFPKGIDIVRKRAFANCHGLLSVTFPEGLRRVENYAFEYCSALSGVELPQSVVSIGEMAFSNCSALKRAEMSENVSDIGSCAFYKTPVVDDNESGFVILGGGVLTACTLDDEEIAVPENVRVIGESSFSCKSLKSVDIPEGVKKIAALAFEQCASLKRVTLPSTLKEIGRSAFVECSALKELSLPNGLVSIGVNAFYDTAMLMSDSSDVIIYNGKYLYRCSVDSLTCDVPEGVTLIADGAFAGASNITDIRLPKSLEYIGAAAFKWLSALKSITIPESVKAIGDEAFMSSYELHAVMYAKGKRIGEGVFPHGSRLTLTDNGRPFTITLVDDISGGSSLFKFAADPNGESFRALEFDEYMIPAAAAYYELINECKKYLKDNITLAVCYAVNLKDEALLEALLRLDIASADELDDCISYAIAHERLDEQLVLMRRKNELPGSGDVAGIIDDKFSL